jgi:hypothetical protein
MNYVNKFCETTTNTSVVYNDINIYDKDINEEEMCDFFKVKNIHFKNKILIGGVGSICHRKGFDIFIKLAELYEDFVFVWATNNTYNKILPKNLHIIHCNTLKDMAIFYKSISVLLLTSRSESFSLSFWECLLNQKYVIACNKTIPLDDKIFQNSNVELLNNISNEKAFIPFLEDIKNNNIDLDKLNKNINIDFIKQLCSKNIQKIQNIIFELIDDNNLKTHLFIRLLKLHLI